MNVTEGERFVVSGVKLEGNYLGKEDEFKSLVTDRARRAVQRRPGGRDHQGVHRLLRQLRLCLRALWRPRPEIDRANNRVAFVLMAEPSRRAYVRRVNIAGNNRTRDEVIRREFRQFESSWYDADKIKLSRDRIDRLGYFKEVNVETSDVPGAPDQVDLNITVAEKPTGSLQLGAGFSSAEKLALSFSIKQENVFGTGNYLGVEVNTSKYNRTIVFNSVNPYFTPDGISRTFDLYHRTSRPYDDQGGNYELATTGAGLRFGVPFSELDTVFFGGAPGAHADQARAPTSRPPTWPMPTSSASPAPPCRCRSAGRATIATARSRRTRGRYQRAGRRSWAWSATRSYFRAQLPVPAVSCR